MDISFIFSKTRNNIKGAIVYNVFISEKIEHKKIPKCRYP